MEAWNHLCTAMNAVTGEVLLVVNGEVAFNGILDFLKDSEDRKPVSALNSTWFYGEANCLHR